MFPLISLAMTYRLYSRSRFWSFIRRLLHLQINLVWSIHYRPCAGNVFIRCCQRTLS